MSRLAPSSHCPAWPERQAAPGSKGMTGPVRRVAERGPRGGGWPGGEVAARASRTARAAGAARGGERAGGAARGGCGILARVEPCAYASFDIPGYIGALRREGQLLAGEAQRAGLAARVPSCPGWAVRDLLKHTGYVHRWATGFVAQGLIRPAGDSEEEILSQGPGDAELPGWFREGHAALVQALSVAGPDLNCWAFLAAPSPLAFWARRQAHETAIRGVGAGQAAVRPGEAGSAPGEAAGAPGDAAGAPGDAARTSGNAASTPGDAASTAGPAAPGTGTPFDPAFAADGVDELLMGFLTRKIRRGSWDGLGGSLAIHADDGAAGRADWLVEGGPGAPGVSRGASRADCDVAGPASGLYLMLWNRRPADQLQVTGDPGILAAVNPALHITWS